MNDLLPKFILHLENVGIEDVPEVGGKNASLGEMIQSLPDIDIPSGFVVTATAYRYFLSQTGLDKYIKEELKNLNTLKLADLAQRGRNIREKIKASEFPDDLKKNQKLPQPVITPTTHGGGAGGHDERLTREEIIKRKLDITIISESPSTWQDKKKKKKIFENLNYKF